MPKFRGYEPLNKSLIWPALVNIFDQFAPNQGSSSYRIPVDEKRNNVIAGSVDWLYYQGWLVKDEGSYIFDQAKNAYFEKSTFIRAIVAQYENLGKFAEWLISGAGKEPDNLQSELERLGVLKGDKEAEIVEAALIPVFVTILFETVNASKFDNEIKQRFFDQEWVNWTSLFPQHAKNVTLIEMLAQSVKSGLIEENQHNQVRLTSEGKELIKLGGYAELILSYYRVFTHINEIASGKLTYGLFGDINRHANLNARASNGILALRVAPTITDLINNDAFVIERLNEGGGVVLDFGSGGGILTQQLFKANGVKRCFGMDINPAAIEEARLVASKNGYSEEQIEFIQGSLMDRAFFELFMDKLAPGQKPVCSINFILHDVGEKNARLFLQNYLTVFGSTPLIITESFRLPDNAMRDHPNYQGPSFKFMHDISGQELFFKDQFEEILRSEGFEIKNEVPHSSMYWGKKDKRLTTIATYVVEPIAC